MLTLSNKLYIQMEPSATDMHRLLTIQDQLPLQKTTRLISAGALHLTIIHIGVLSKLVQSIQSESVRSTNEIMGHIENFAHNAEALTKSYVEDVPFLLIPKEFDVFGRNNTSLVLTFYDSDALSLLHKKSLTLLKNLLTACGITSIDNFMRADPNLRYALDIKPHITLAKSFYPRDTRDTLILSTDPYTLDLMRVVY